MPAAALLPLALGGSAAIGLIGASKASKAAKQAATTQTASTDRAAALQFQLGNRALDFQREAWQQAQANAAPYLAAGSTALGGLMGLTGLNGSSPGAGAGAGLAQIMGPAAGGYQAPEMVSMRSPTGQIKSVPRAMVPHFESRGAVVVS